MCFSGYSAVRDLTPAPGSLSHSNDSGESSGLSLTKANRGCQTNRIQYRLCPQGRLFVRAVTSGATRTVCIANVCWSERQGTQGSLQGEKSQQL